jgi:hypothetical protein
MHDLVPVLAIGIIVVSGISLLVAVPKPHDAMTKVREFSGRPQATPAEHTASAPEPDTSPKATPAWGNLNFDIFSDSETPSP